MLLAVDALGNLGNAVSGDPKCLSKEKTGKENAHGSWTALGHLGKIVTPEKSLRLDVVLQHKRASNNTRLIYYSIFRFFPMPKYHYLTCQSARKPAWLSGAHLGNSASKRYLAHRLFFYLGRLKMTQL